jgi:hypothetical protein
MRTNLLNELKKSFLPYSLLWDDWTKAGSCILSKEEIYAVNIQIANGFKVDIGDFMMFYNKIEIIESVIQKLRMAYKDFQEWVLLRFANQVLRLTNANNLRAFLETPINDLCIKDELKVILQKFNRDTLNKIFTTYTDDDFKKENAFQNMVLFQTHLTQ